MGDPPRDEFSSITLLLRAAYDGEPGAFDQVIELVYSDLRRLAAKQLAGRQARGLADLSLEPAALVNETYLKLIRQRKRYDNRGQFFAIATRMMLRVLMNHHRDQRAAKRGGGLVRVTISDAAQEAAPRPTVEIPAFVEALEQLEKADRRTADVVELRVIWGLTVPEIARTLELSVATIEREWSFGQRWLATRLM